MDLLTLVSPYQGSVVAISHQRPFERYAHDTWDSQSDLVVRRTTLTFAAKKGDAVAIGVNIGYNQLKIHYATPYLTEKFSGDGYSFEVGLLIQPDSVLSMGFTLQPGTEFSGHVAREERTAYDNTFLTPLAEKNASHEIPFHLRFGMGLKPTERMKIATGFNLPSMLCGNCGPRIASSYSSYSLQTLVPSVQGGVEYWVTNNLPLRLGAFQMADETALTFGSGLRKGSIMTDIAFIRFPSEGRQETRGILSLSYALQR